MIKSSNNKGITLTTLVVTIVVLLILAGVATSTGIEAIENTKHTKFVAELKIMQSYVNQWYEDCKSNNVETWGENVSKKFLNSGAIQIKDDENNDNDTVTIIEKAKSTLGVANIPSANYSNFYYLSNSTLNTIGVEGVSQDVLVSVQDRKVVSYLGLKYKNTMYYTIDDQSGNGIDEVYNVEYDSSLNSGEVTFDVSQEYIGNGQAKITISNIEFAGYNNKWNVRYKLDNKWYDVTNAKFDTDNINFIVTKSGTYTVALKNEGIYGTSKDTNGNEAGIKVLTAPECWEATTASDPSWYNYGGAKVNQPKLTGKMTPIKYSGTLTDNMNKTNLWANAETADQSMWVWIPRYAYKINYFTDDTYTTRSSTKTMYGTIDIAFLKNTTDEFWDSSNAEIAEITRNPTDTGAGTTKWLVHPAFTVQYNQDGTKNYDNGGWDEELTGIWVGKFRATGSYTDNILSTKPGSTALNNMKINQQYKFAQTGTFSENNILNCHMLKNSEKGAVSYLAYSSFGLNGRILVKESSLITTGDSKNISTIYATNYTKNTTQNPYGIYDLCTDSVERQAAYVNYSSTYTNLSTNGGIEIGDLYGASTIEQSTSTKFKTVYSSVGTAVSSSYNLLNTTDIKKGDAIFETSLDYSGNDLDNKTVSYPEAGSPFFSFNSLFCFSGKGGGSSTSNCFRVCLAF